VFRPNPPVEGPAFLAFNADPIAALNPAPGSAVSNGDLSRTYLTTHQVARMVGASPSTVLSWVDRGWLPAHRTPGGHRRIERQALVEFLRAHDMPELVADTEPLRLLLALGSPEQAKRLAEALRAGHPELRVDVAEGVVEALAHLFDSPPDALLVDATLAGIDIHVLCRELGTCSVSARVRVVVVRPPSMSELDEPLREVGVWAVLNSPASQDTIAECLSLGSFELTRPKAS
jgi:excisionase family DNA binding protein